MIVDRRQKNWILATVVLFLACLFSYIPYALSAPNGPSGGSWPGLIYGVVGSGMILFALLLGPRKKVPTLRVGRLQSWMKGHVWLGLLSFPIIWFHAGFSLGGTLTTVLMILFSLIFLSGIFGLVLQQFVPRAMIRDLPLETIYEQIDHVIEQLRIEADDLVAEITNQETDAFSFEAVAPGESRTQTSESSPSAILKAFHQEYVRPYLSASGDPAAQKIHEEHRSELLFHQMTQILPDSLHPTLEKLDLLVEERRQLARQKKWHSLLHGWLFVHVPLSVALLVLGVVHAVTAVRYI